MNIGFFSKIFKLYVGLAILLYWEVYFILLYWEVANTLGAKVVLTEELMAPFLYACSV